MAILFCGIVMSHYVHLSLSPMTQVTMQQTARTLAFISETCVFIYLGIAFFSMNLIWSPALIIWSIALCIVARAINIFPLSFLLNYVRTHKITKNNQFIMWFSGLRGKFTPPDRLFSCKFINFHSQELLLSLLHFTWILKIQRREP